MRANFKRYVDQCYRSVKMEKSRRVVESRPVCMDLEGWVLIWDLS
jgi:hypothetical protein